MKVVRKSEGTSYEAPLHFNVWSSRKLAADKETQRISVSLSHFQPNGRCDMSGSPAEKVYFVLAGSMAVKNKAGEEAILQTGDTVYFAGGEERECYTVGTDVCTILVCMVKV
ncbi:MAG: cupin domain-containing protein [Dehalococcoidales bacterium]|nr:cupin domain-containing protein [Dehalococcoidales bacterium]